MRHPRLLIVDDDPDMAVVLGARFKARRFEVDCAVDGVEAVAAFGRRKPDVVLLDLHTPRLDGLAVMRAMREQDPAARIIIVTGDTDRSLAEQLLDDGANDVLIKPIDLDDLDAAVETNLPR